MRHNNSGRRSRSRGGNGNNGRRNGSPRMQTYDSNGPDVRIRGNAFQIAEKYQNLARDAESAGDKFLAENYLQHAEHYQRIVNVLAPQNNDEESKSDSSDSNAQPDENGADKADSGAAGRGQNRNRRPQRDKKSAPEASANEEGPEVEAPAAAEA